MTASLMTPDEYDRLYEEAKPTPEQVAEDLLAAADILEVDGWTQDMFHRADGCHCAQGALALAVGTHKLGIDPEVVKEAARDGVPVEEYAEFDDEEQPWWHDYGDLAANRRFKEADRALRTAVGTTFVPAWNDTKDRTAEEVIAGIRKAAAEVLGL